MTMNRLILPWFLTSTIIILIWASIGQTQSSAQFKRDQEVIRIQMVQLSRELGVTCTECHSQKNWKDDSKPSFKTGLQHMKIVEVLRQNGMDGKAGPEASCYTCHQGRLRFTHKMVHPEGNGSSKK